MANALNVMIPAVLFALALLIIVRGVRKRRAGHCANCPYRGGCAGDACEEKKKP